MAISFKRTFKVTLLNEYVKITYLKPDCFLFTLWSNPSLQILNKEISAMQYNSFLENVFLACYSSVGEEDGA